jgi:hypothetical protein
MNLGKVIEEMDVFARNPKERSTIIVKDFTPQGKKNIKEFLTWLQEFKTKNNIRC